MNANANRISDNVTLLPLSLLLIISALTGAIGICTSASLPVLAFILAVAFACYILAVRPVMLLSLYYAMVILIPSFVYIRIGFVYVTELALFLFFIHVIFSGRSDEVFRCLKSNRFMSFLFAIFLMAGVISSIRGFNYGLVAARDAVTVFYCVVTFLVVAVLRTENDVKNLLTSFVLIAVVFNVLIFLRVISGGFAGTEFGAPRIFASRSSGFLFLAGCISVSNVFDIKSPLGSALLRIFGLGQFGMLFLLSGTRNVWIATVISLAFWFVFLRRRVKPERLLIYLTVVILVGTTIMSVISKYDDKSFVDSYLMSVESIFDYHKSANAKDRVEWWRWGVKSALDYNPVFGKPFGSMTIFMKYSRQHDTKLKMAFHNSYITIFYYTGLLGFSAILLLLVYFLNLGLRLSKCRGSPTGRLAEIITVSFVFYATIASFNVILEGPQSATLFWLLSGVLLVLQKLSAGDDRA